MSISTKNLTIGYKVKHNEYTVAKDINATIESGKLTCLLGPNGAGKSTLLRTLSGALAPIAGEIYYDNLPLDEISPTLLAKKVSVVLTDRLDLPNMTVRETVALGRNPYTGFFGRLSSFDHQIVEQALHSVGIYDLRNKRIANISDGERQKAMIAKALAQQTSAILLDEPTAFLDFPSKVEIMLMLRKIANENNKSIFLSTHDLEIALQTADALWLLDKKKGLKIGTIEDLAMNHTISDYFDSLHLHFNPENKDFYIG